ncbi:MAG: hypothetical protein M3137_16335, partial [Actinomycetota bacterium]|nr:hypothetical protein [Actinomycetota bacterium]
MTALPGSAYLQLVGGVSLLQPEEQVLAAMVRGFGIQQQSRYLSALTIYQRDGQPRRFGDWTNGYPWRWKPQDVEEWTAAAITERHLARSTVRTMHLTIKLFMDYRWASTRARRCGGCAPAAATGRAMWRR